MRNIFSRELYRFHWKSYGLTTHSSTKTDKSEVMFSLMKKCRLSRSILTYKEIFFGMLSRGVYRKSVSFRTVRPSTVDDFFNGDWFVVEVSSSVPRLQLIRGRKSACIYGSAGTWFWTTAALWDWWNLALLSCRH